VIDVQKKKKNLAIC